MMGVSSNYKESTPCNPKVKSTQNYWTPSSTEEDSGYFSSHNSLTPSSEQNSPYCARLLLETPDRTVRGLIAETQIYKEQYVDIIGELTKKGDFPEIIEKILSYLTPDDLIRCCLVSKTWKHVCDLDNKSIKRRNQFLSKPGVKEKENLGKPEDFVKSKIKSPQRRHTSTPFQDTTVLRQINVQTSLIFSPVQAPVEKIKDRHEIFVDEGKKLGPKKTLRPCPRCHLASRVDKDISAGQCTQPNCRFQYCLVCFGEYHLNKSQCPALNSKTEGYKWPRSLVSKNTRKRLKRYLPGP